MGRIARYCLSSLGRKVALTSSSSPLLISDSMGVNWNTGEEVAEMLPTGVPSLQITSFLSLFFSLNSIE